MIDEATKGLVADNERLRKRDCNAHIQLCYDDGNNPFAREDLKVADVGVCNNVYVVEFEVLSKALAEIDRLKKAIRDGVKPMGTNTIQQIMKDAGKTNALEGRPLILKSCSRIKNRCKKEK